VAPAETKALVRRLLEESLTGARPDASDELVSERFVGHAPANPEFHGPGGLKAYAALLRKGFPDLEATVEEVFGEDDRVAAEFTLRGTQRGRFRGVPKTGRRIELPANAMVRVSGGLVEELWAEWDQKLLLEQLNVLPVLIRSE
jgi:predicted ester cyclase